MKTTNMIDAGCGIEDRFKIFLLHGLVSAKINPPDGCEE